jgi:3-deoxy-D-manno-octulosonic-acid transferase
LNPKRALGLWGWAMRLASPVLLARWWWRGRQEPGYRLALIERLGLYSGRPEPGAVWLHAVSLGETRAATPLVAALRQQCPGVRLLLTHTTATGRAAGAELLRAGDAQCWLPIDTPGSVRRFLAHWRPAVGVLMETEVWPQLQAAAAQAHVPTVLANARLSARSLRRGQRFESLMRPAAAHLSAVLAQTEDDAERLRHMGATSVQVAGNLKFDLQPDATLLAQGQAWRAASSHRLTLMLAVSREGEEALFLDAWAALPEAERPRVLIVPRHPQRFDEVAELVRRSGLRLSRRSSWTDAPDEADVWLGDSLREMPLYYGLADVALLGGSFAPLGGQNLIEAAACGTPLVMGPHTFNFEQAAEGALEAGAALRATDMPSGVAMALQLLRTPTERQRVAEAGVRFAQAHQGAAARMAAAVLDHSSLRNTSLISNVSF